MSAVPTIPRGVRLHWDKVRQSNVLLGPERALMLDDIAFEILSRVTGIASIEAISSDLAETFEAPLDQVAEDVSAFLGDLKDKRLLDMAYV